MDHTSLLKLYIKHFITKALSLSALKKWDFITLNFCVVGSSFSHGGSEYHAQDSKYQEGHDGDEMLDFIYTPKCIQAAISTYFSFFLLSVYFCLSHSSAHQCSLLWNQARRTHQGQRLSLETLRRTIKALTITSLFYCTENKNNSTKQLILTSCFHFEVFFFVKMIYNQTYRSRCFLPSWAMRKRHAHFYSSRPAEANQLTIHG